MLKHKHIRSVPHKMREAIQNEFTVKISGDPLSDEQVYKVTRLFDIELQELVEKYSGWYNFRRVDNTFNKRGEWIIFLYGQEDEVRSAFDSAINEVLIGA